ncbi:MAG TPA: S-layer homology domain-containing protein, partial [Anaerolineales bacterium]|nr:S-layer homology domain-containing protein [Anaerolineales bacterium]
MNNFLFSPSFRKTLQAALLLTILFFSLGPAGTFTVYAAPPSNDNFANGTVITTIPYTNTVVTTEATEQASEPPVPTACDGRLLDLGVKTVWYRYTPTVTGPVYADSFGTDYDTYIAVWRGSSLGTLTFVTCDDDNEAGGYESQVGWTATAGVTYHIQVAGYDGTVGIPNQGNSGGTLPFHMTSFRDVPGDYWAWRYVEGLFDAGVTAGCNTNPALYCPLGGITRDQMAVFLLKAIHGANYTPPPATGDFLDVPTNYWAAAWIEQLYAEGITAGCTVNPNNFCPTTPVARDQMA